MSMSSSDGRVLPGNGAEYDETGTRSQDPATRSGLKSTAER
ncbi:hypothetical protein ACFWY6_18410 [Streptomyces sp. NPDC059037]